MRDALVGNVHIVEGGAETVEDVCALLARTGIEVHGNPDVYVKRYARFGADDAREIVERAALRPVGTSPRTFIIATPTLTAEAQNVLLKTLEESQGDSLFFLIVPTPQALLPTLLSRAQVLALDTRTAAEPLDTRAFLAAAPEKRLDMLKPLLEKDEDDKRDLRPIFAFLAAVEARLAAHPDGSRATACREGLEAVYRARAYLGDKGALLKPLLEQVALLVPRV